MSFPSPSIWQVSHWSQTRFKQREHDGGWQGHITGERADWTELERGVSRKASLTTSILENTSCHSLQSGHNNLHPFHKLNTITPKVLSAPNPDAIDIKSREDKALQLRVQFFKYISWGEILLFWLTLLHPLLPFSCSFSKLSRVGVQVGRKAKRVRMFTSATLPRMFFPLWAWQMSNTACLYALSGDPGLLYWAPWTAALCLSCRLLTDWLGWYHIAFLANPLGQIQWRGTSRLVELNYSQPTWSNLNEKRLIYLWIKKKYKQLPSHSFSHLWSHSRRFHWRNILSLG